MDLILIKEHIFARSTSEEDLYRGHDLYIDPADGLLTLTGGTELCKFNCVTGERKTVVNINSIKSASFTAGAPAMLLIPNEQWWNDTLTLLSNGGTTQPLCRYPHFRFYKARWIPDDMNIFKNKDVEK